VREREGVGSEVPSLTADTLQRLGVALAVPAPIPAPVLGPEIEPPPAGDRGARGAGGGSAPPSPESAPRAREILVAWVLLTGIARVHGSADPAASLARWWSDWSWDRVVAASLGGTGLDAGAAWQAAERIAALAAHVDGFRAAATAREPRPSVLDGWLADERVRRLLGVNLHQGTWWIGKEALEDWLGWLLAAAAIERDAGGAAKGEREREGRGARDLARRVLEAAAEAGYRAETLAERVRG
jgi:hypothetical protein